MRRRSLDLFLLGFLTLFLELALIRYLAGNVWNLGYFPNLILMGVFVGMGAGFVFHSRASERASVWLFQAAALALLALVALVSVARPAVPGFGALEGEVGGELFFTATSQTSDASLWLFAVWFGAVVIVFALVAQRTAKVFRQLPPLRAYTFDIAGSIAGIASFMVASRFELPAWSWFASALVLFVAGVGAGAGRVRWLAAAPLALTALVAHQQDQRPLAHPGYAGPFELSWSPYQRVEYLDHPRAPMHVYVNGILHQAMSRGEDVHAFYPVPHERRRRAGLPPYRSVLVIGAGSGNDVATALANGAEHVDAVEIDPAIARIGKRHHPARPYDDPRVNLVVDDARAFMTRTTRRYDLVIFALTDSLVKVSSMSQLRLENYLFTVDALRRAYGLLSESGDLLLYNYYRRPWLAEKFAGMLFEVTGRSPVVIFERDDFKMLLTGRFNGMSAPPRFANGPPELPTDDWPFPYLQRRGVPSLYLSTLVGLGFAIAMLMALMQRSGPRSGVATRLAFVLMGAAFLLLETKSIVQFSLLFGTTWVNSSLVFVAVLTLVLAANWTATLLRGRWLLPVAFALLLVSCFATLVFPLRELLAVESLALRFVLASLLTFSAIFFANLIFSVTFRDQEVPEQMFGWNLLGATAGGLVEYTSMAFGYDALAWVVALAYAAVFGLLWTREQSTVPAS